MACRAKLADWRVIVLAAAVSCAPGASDRPSHPEQPPLTTTYDGSVIGVDNQSPDRAMVRNVRLRLQPTGGTPVDVDLAPGWYLDEHGLRFSPKERVEVETTRHPGQTTVVARKVRRGQTTVVLRDANGNPTWENKE